MAARPWATRTTRGCFPTTGTISGNPDIVMPSSATTKHVAHRVALVTAALWWAYAFFSTSFFTNLSASELVVYMVGLLMCYALVYFGVLGVTWVTANIGS